MKHGAWFLCITTLILVLTISAGAEARRMTKTENIVESAAGVTTVQFRDLSFTTLTYKGITGADRFMVKFDRIVKADDDSDLEDIFSRLSLETVTSGGVTTFRLIHPSHRTGGVLNRIFDRKEWEVELEITGPDRVDIDIVGGFSKLRTSSTTGTMKIKADFSDTVISSHYGQVNGTASFGSFRIENLDGSFDLNGDFCDSDISMIRLAGNSNADFSFGSLDLRLPRDAGAEFRTDKSFGSVNFRTSDTPLSRGNDSSRRVLGGGGPIVDLNAEFGEINVRNDMRQTVSSRQSSARSRTIMPLNEDAWWRYRDGDESMTIMVEDTRFVDRNPGATLRISVGGRKQADIDVYDTTKGLHVSRIDGEFFGKDLTGVSFTPPRLWLPYDENVTIDNDFIFGTVSMTKVRSFDTPAGTMTDVYQYRISYDGQETQTIVVAPGIGIAAVNSFRLEADDIGEEPPSARVEQPTPEPRFEEGVLKSIKISGGRRFLAESEIREMLDLTAGQTYTRAEIDAAVDDLERKHRFISFTSYTIDAEGNLNVRVYEKRAHTRDFDLDASFTRIGGVGIGPELTITSLVGPLSEIKGSTQYHFADKEWTYRASAEKSFFQHNRLAFGGTYRLDYESSMDWAIPKSDGYLNAFLFGLETNHYHQVEGATGYGSLSFGNIVRLKGEYFEEKFSSLKKHTNWSLFNHRHVKDDNLPLAPIEEGRLVGIRMRGEFSYGTSLMNTGLIVEAEQALDKGHNTVGEYTRYFGNAVNTWKLSRDNYLKIRLAGGYSEDALPAYRAFNLGGLNTLRGYDYQSLPGGLPFDFQYGGNRMALCNVEYFVGEEDEVGFIVFADAGGVWMKNQEFDLKDVSRDIGVSFAIDTDFFDFDPDDIPLKKPDVEGLRINWAVPVGNVPHVSHWTVNFARAF